MSHGIPSIVLGMRPRFTFRPDTDIPDLSGKVILVTGGNIGLGRETILQLSKHNPAHIYLAARSKAKAENAIEELRKAVPDGAPISFLHLDLSSFESIKAAAETFLTDSSRLDILINNAGVMALPEGLTTEGYEIQFGTNHVGHALFTQLLLPTLEETAALPSADVRVVFVSSALEASAPKNSYQFDKFKTAMPHISTWARYATSKLANIHYAYALARRYPRIKVMSLHPGVVYTNLTNSLSENYIISSIVKAGTYFFSVSVDKGARTPLWAATSPDAQSGVYYFAGAITGKGSRQSSDEKVQEDLWNWTQKELEPHLPPDQKTKLSRL
jgi:NAD(P)-dependent dehydrogenase (short-subunit alcohol dehydrogenase family)